MATTDCPTCHQQVRIVNPSTRGSVPAHGVPVYAWHARPGNPLGPNAGPCAGSRTTVGADALERAI